MNSEQWAEVAEKLVNVGEGVRYAKGTRHGCYDDCEHECDVLRSYLEEVIRILQQPETADSRLVNWDEWA